jgi:hypothetical protein
MRYLVGGSLAVGGLLVVYGALTGRLAPMIAAIIRPDDLIASGTGGDGTAVAGTGSTPDVPANPLGRNNGPAPLQNPTHY